MNKMIHSFKIFEELRADRIAVENRKFDVLANMVKKPVLLANAKGELIYLNNHVYSLLQIQSEDCIGKTMKDTLIPESIIETYELAIRRRSKIENSQISIIKKDETSELEDKIAIKTDLDSEGQIKDEEEKEVEYVYQGYASVIPIRGKESSLDYYLMVMSKEVQAI